MESMDIVKRKIRNNVFETNSSSSHSISIVSRSNKVYSDIPYNSKIILTGDNNFSVEIYDEIGKLNYMVCLLASIIYDEYYYGKNRLTLDEFVNHNYYKWLKEIIKEERNTEVLYEPCDVRYYPYFDTVYDDYSSAKDIFTERKYDIDNEEDFKNRCKDIIFNKEIIIIDKEEEY